MKFGGEQRFDHYSDSDADRKPKVALCFVLRSGGRACTWRLGLCETQGRTGFVEILGTAPKTKKQVPHPRKNRGIRDDTRFESARIRVQAELRLQESQKNPTRENLDWVREWIP